MQYNTICVNAANAGLLDTRGPGITVTNMDRLNSLMPSDAFMRQLTIINSDNVLLPGRRQAIIWTNGGFLLIGPLETKVSEILTKTQFFSFAKMHMKISPVKRRPFRPEGDELLNGSRISCKSLSSSVPYNYGIMCHVDELVDSSTYPSWF